MYVLSIYPTRPYLLLLFVSLFRMDALWGNDSWAIQRIYYFGTY